MVNGVTENKDAGWLQKIFLDNSTKVLLIRKLKHSLLVRLSSEEFFCCFLDIDFPAFVVSLLFFVCNKILLKW